MTDKFIDELKQKLQPCFSDKTVVIVGSGLSNAEGIPGMYALSQHLCKTIPSLISPDDETLWKKISGALAAGLDLESTLLMNTPSDDLVEKIVRVTSDLMLEKEQEVLQECVLNQRELKISKLLPHLSPSDPKIINIVTTNYDRLIEFAAESSGYGVDSMIVGRYWGVHAPKESIFSLCRGVQSTARKLTYKKRVHIYKPHGSLDWYETPQGVISSPLNFDYPRKIITPGIQKYKYGYESPFDDHREKANRKIDEASSLIFIGYGFNDDHLQTHIVPRLKNGTRGIIMSRSLSGSAKEIIKNSPNLIGLSKTKQQGELGTLISEHSLDTFIPNVHWWDIENFVIGVLSA